MTRFILLSFQMGTSGPRSPNAARSGLSALGGFRQSGNGPSRRPASPADAPRNPHKQPNNLTAMVGMIGSISSDAALAENVGLCWHRWHLAIGSGRNAATMD
jgi:hypothetical protein